MKLHIRVTDWLEILFKLFVLPGPKLTLSAPQARPTPAVNHDSFNSLYIGTFCTHSLGGSRSLIQISR